MKAVRNPLSALDFISQRYPAAEFPVVPIGVQFIQPNHDNALLVNPSSILGCVLIQYVLIKAAIEICMLESVSIF